MLDEPEQYVAPVVLHGGLTKEQIELRDLQVQEKIVRMWTHAMDEQNRRVDERFALHEQKDEIRNRTQQSLVNERLDTQDATLADHDVKLDTILKEVRSVITSSKTWHEEDMTFRDDVLAQVRINREGITDVKDTQLAINTKLNFVEWLVTLSRGLLKASGLAKDAGEKVAQGSDSLRAWLLTWTSFCATVLVFWQAFRANGFWSVFQLWLHHKH